MAVTTERARRATAEVASSGWAEPLGRVGLVARGVMYCLVGVLAVQVATGRQERADKSGALATVAHQPFGKAVLIALAVGFAGYAGWRFVKAAVGAGEGGKRRGGDAVGLAKRAGDVGTGVLYLGLFANALRLLMSSNDPSGGGSDTREQGWTARLLQHPWGPWLVALAGAGLIVDGAVDARKGLGQHFRKHLRIGEMKAWQRKWLPVFGAIGYTARGTVIALIGIFLIRAAVQFDPNEAVGIDGALKRVAQTAWGPWLLGLVALGLFCFGLYCFVEARWRKVLEDA